MRENRFLNFTKKDIAKTINQKLGLPHTFSYEITEKLIDIVKDLIKNENLHIKNFGHFNIIKKKQRVGRNPKTNQSYLVSARKSVSFIPSKNLSIKFNKFK